jgi:hypothetical protein
MLAWKVVGVGQPRSTHRRASRTAVDKKRSTADIIEEATTYGRYGYPFHLVIEQIHGFQLILMLPPFVLMPCAAMVDQDGGAYPPDCAPESIDLAFGGLRVAAFRDNRR